MNLPNTKKQTTKRIVQDLFFLSLFLLLAIRYLLFIPVVPGIKAAADCTPSCKSPYWSSWAGSICNCCICIYGDADGYGPRECCVPPGPSSDSCDERKVSGCHPEPDCNKDCGNWKNQECGRDNGGNCADDKMLQTRNFPSGDTGTACEKAGCKKARCVDDPSCEPTPTVPPPVVITPFPLPYVPCDEVRYPEFHSLRPYQASPCDEKYHELAFFCGNDFIVQDDVVIEKQWFPHISPVPWWSSSYWFEDDMIGPVPPPQTDGPPCSYCREGDCIEKEGYCIPSANQCELGDDYACIDRDNCIDNDDGTETCWFNIYHVRDIAIDLEGAYLPIMGNTELVVNSQYQPDPEGLDDGQKVNEYVSWYLNGIIGRAEYDPPDPDEEEGRRKIIDFSGPLKKLISKDSQKEIRKDEIADAKKERHDQIVVCTNLLGQPTHCYSDPERPGISEKRMTNVPKDLYSYVPFSSTEDRMGRAQIYTYSVQPPISDYFVVLVAELIDKEPAELFFSHMQESAELADLLQQTFAPEGAPLDKLESPGYTPPSVFCDIKRIRSNPGDNLFAGEITATLEYDVGIRCDFVLGGNELESGKDWGNLCRHFTNADCISVADNEICAEYYDRFDCSSGLSCARDCGPPPSGWPCGTQCERGCTEGDCFNPRCRLCSFCVGCVPNNWTCTRNVNSDPSLCPEDYKCGEGCTRTIDPLPSPLIQACPKTVFVVLNTLTETPKIDEIWARLVAGPASVFKRIFPRIGEGGAVTGIWDIPGATSVVYETTGVALAGNPAGGRSGDKAELYFPHIGGLHEYFLHCIQTMLRPQGFGFECLTEGPPPWPEDCPAEMWPVTTNNGQKYYASQGPGGSSTHGPPDWAYQEAIDISPVSGSPQYILATHAGVVRQAGVDGWGGLYVQLEANCGVDFISVYVHMDSLRVSAGDTLGIGDVLGPLGNTGYSSGPHLHYEFRNMDGTLKDRADPPPFMVRPFIPKAVPQGCVGRYECAVDIP